MSRSWFHPGQRRHCRSGALPVNPPRTGEGETDAGQLAGRHFRIYGRLERGVISEDVAPRRFEGGDQDNAGNGQGCSDYSVVCI